MPTGQAFFNCFFVFDLKGPETLRFLILLKKGAKNKTCMKTIYTPHLQLISCDREIFESIFQGDKALARKLGIKVSGQWSEFGLEPIRFGHQALDNDPSLEGWWTYLVIHSSDNRLIGTCGYKGKPNKQGIVEIGYEVMEEYRNRGFATELAKGLIKNAFSFPRVKIVQAHTLAEKNASGTVLTRCGMTFIHELADPEDGLIWLWQLDRKTFEKH